MATPLISALVLIVSTLQIVICAEFQVLTSFEGGFKVVVQNHTWLNSSSVFFHADNCVYTTSDGTLVLLRAKKDAGIDVIGRWKSMIYAYKTWNSSLMFETEIRAYSDAEVVTFGQRFLQDTLGTSAGSVGKVSSGFPTFSVPEKGSEPTLGYYAPVGYMAGDDSKEFGRWNTNDLKLLRGHVTGPISLYDGQGNALVISHLTNFMGASLWYDKGTKSVSYGALGKAEAIPRGFDIWTIISYSSSGVNKAFLSWGNLMQKFYNCKSAEMADGDFTINYVGYFTDNGASYYYNPEKGQTYEQTVLHIKEYADIFDIPYRYLQLDSWFYPKHPNSRSGGVLRWEPDPVNFPHGMGPILEKTRWPIFAHCKWWSPATPMAKENGGKYNFVIEKNMALPVDQQLWMDIFSKARQWGLVYFEQDWLAPMFDGLEILQSNVTIGRMWLNQMARGLYENSILLQQCTSYPRHVLAGLEMGLVTQQRVSMDFALSKDNWKIGISSLWVSALGQRPFKDIFRAEGPGGVNATLHSVAASLSRGPYATADSIGAMNRDLIMRSCNSEGKLLKPDIAATAIDDQFYQSSFGRPEDFGEVWTTHSEISGFFFGMIFAAEVNSTFYLTPLKAFRPVGKFPSSYIFHYDQPWTLREFSETAPLKLQNCTYKDFCLYYTSPILTMGGRTVILLGETTKWISFSNDRISRLENALEDVRVTLKGVSGEEVLFKFVIDPDGAAEYTTVSCTMGDDGSAVLSVFKGRCL